MGTYYSDDRGTQIVLSLLKAHGIRKVIASPGTTNIALVGSMQNDSFFEIYSSVDERSAAYMACGLAYASGEPVVLTCTEATASRNYFPGLTEAYYRKLPILAITGNHGIHRVGHLIPQVIDRSQAPIDTVNVSVNIGKCKDKDDEWLNIINANKAILALFQNGGGPSHINLQFSKNTYNTKELPPCRIIKRYHYYDKLPEVSYDRIAIFIGSHKPFSEEETKMIDSFCESNNAVVFCDKTSAYIGKYRIDYALVSSQMNYTPETNYMDLLIHIGEVSGDTYTQSNLRPKNTWRVSEDGEIRDTFRSLKAVFQMREIDFFKHFIGGKRKVSDYFDICIKEYKKITDKLPDIGFSNIWIAKTLAGRLPEDSYLHLGIFNSLRSWNFSKIDKTISSICNVGGFGIDGALSTVLGASLSNPKKLYFAIVGDLAFFYDMNSLGNRHLGNNLRILVVNNGRGTEFRKYDHPCYIFGEDADPYMAAAGHFGNKSPELIKNYAKSLGIKYLNASGKDMFLKCVEAFVNPLINESIIFEVFTETKEESEAVDKYRHIFSDNKTIIKKQVKGIIGKILKA